MKLFTVFSEWDIGFGHNDCFEAKSMKSATKEIREMYNFQDMEEQVEMTFDEAISMGLIHINVKK